MNFRRHNYDKGWRCPGWSGGGFSSPRPSRDICQGGSFAPHWNHGCQWHFHKCQECGTIAIPLVTKWLDPTWLKWWIERDIIWEIRDRWSQYMELRYADECGCEDQCAYCQEHGHSACWREVAVWRRLWILWKERHAR